MKVYKFICPGCSKEYKITAQDEAKPTGDFTCKCGFRAPLEIVLSWSNEITGEKKNNQTGHLPTQIKGSATSSDNSQLPTTVTQKASISFQPTNGEPAIPLNVGQYTIGRKSSDSTATLKLASDRSMSRVHAELNVLSDNKCYIKPLNINNPVLRNQRPIPFGTYTELSANDTIQLGNSKFVIIKK